MKNKIFNPKFFQGKNRVYSKVEKGISRCWSWDSLNAEYRFVYFEARKKGLVRKEDKLTFQDLKAAKQWLYNTTVQTGEPIDNSPMFKNVVAQWEREQLISNRNSTKNFYKSKYRYLEVLNELKIESIRPKNIENWVNWMKQLPTKNTRTSYDKEIKFVRVIFQFYKERSENAFDIPLRKHHFTQGFVKEKELKTNIISEKDFLKLRDLLDANPKTQIYAAIATAQFYHCLRISEATAICKEDLCFDNLEPINNVLTIRRMIDWARVKGDKTKLVASFKNSGSVGIKNSVIHPNALPYLQKYAQQVDSGLIFNEDGKPVSYRRIQRAFDVAFKCLGLPYTATHCMRKGGATMYYSDHGNASFAQAQLGVTNMQTTQVYAKPVQNDVNLYMANLYERYAKDKSGS